MDFAISVSPRDHTSAGVRVMYRLADLLRAAGHSVQTEPGHTITSETVAIYAEVTVGNPFHAKRVVRYVLNRPGVFGVGETAFPAGDLVLYYEAQYEAAARAAAADGVAHEHYVAVIEPELFYPRPAYAMPSGDCWYMGKAEVFGQPAAKAARKPGALDAWYGVPEKPYQRMLEVWYPTTDWPKAPPGIQIRRSFNGYPRTRAELADLLRDTRTLRSFDPNSMLLKEARICGADVLVWHEGEWVPWDCDWHDYAQRWHDGVCDANRLVTLIEQHFATSKRQTHRLMPLSAL